eukprot:CAMPEP_0174833064 /NCGR_PEP_ID=MMETSP1114-20130205/4012_1 /TAXON_ID=312471 /ORGANISM="Neobodo designis, Strain CCAP 1951/1" /LENGTH=244 /DNA_ID=CAMNT_0016066935 /DNA_START=93 /DNA_END=827 /DNA_ORIENTATION=-
MGCTHSSSAAANEHAKRHNAAAASPHEAPGDEQHPPHRTAAQSRSRETGPPLPATPAPSPLTNATTAPHASAHAAEPMDMTPPSITATGNPFATPTAAPVRRPTVHLHDRGTSVASGGAGRRASVLEAIGRVSMTDTPTTETGPNELPAASPYRRRRKQTLSQASLLAASSVVASPRSPGIQRASTASTHDMAFALPGGSASAKSATDFLASWMDGLAPSAGDETGHDESQRGFADDVAMESDL